MGNSKSKKKSNDITGEKVIKLNLKEKPGPRMLFGMCISDTNIVYIFGGETGFNYYNDLWCIDCM